MLMISDFVDEGYDADDLKKEKMFLEEVENELKKHGIGFSFFEFKTLEELDVQLKKFERDRTVIFNWAEEIYGKPNTGAEITKYLDKNGWIYSGARTDNLILANDRGLVNKLLRENNVGVPEEYELGDEDIKFPVIIKAKYEHGSFGISKKSILENKEELEKYKCGIKPEKYLAEQFIDGPEYTISVWGNKNPEVLPIMDIKFESNKHEKHKIISYGSKWDKDDPDFEGVYSGLAGNLGGERESEIKKMCLKAFKVLGCSGIVRFEIREDENKEEKNERVVDEKKQSGGGLYIIDFNPNPNFAIDSAFMKSAREKGLNYGQVVLRLCEFSLESRN